MALQQWKEALATSDTALTKYRSPDLQLPAGADLPRLSWCRLNRLLSGDGRTAACFCKWGLVEEFHCRQL